MKVKSAGIVPKAIMITFLFALISTIFAVRVQGIVYDVASCDELRAVDDDIATGLTITADAIDCSVYTRFRVRNGMIITATVPEVTFSNFSLKVLGDLTVEPGVVFQSVYNEVSPFHPEVSSLLWIHGEYCVGSLSPFTLIWQREHGNTSLLPPK